MVFVVASHTMVVNANANPDGTMKRSKTPTNLPKSDLRGRWVKEDPRLAVVPAEQAPGAYTYTTKATSVRTREDHSGSGKQIRYQDIFDSFDKPQEALEFTSRSRSLASPSSKALGRSVSLRDELYEPMSTVTEKFKSITTRKPVKTWTTPAQRNTSTEYEYHRPVFSSVEYKPPIPTSALTTSSSTMTRASRSSASRAQSIRASSPSSNALVPFEKKSSALTNYTSDLNFGRLEPPEPPKYSSLYATKSSISQRSVEELVSRAKSSIYDAPLRPPPSSAYPSSFRGLTLVANVHDRDSRNYTLPPRKSYKDYMLPDYGRALPAAPTGFQRADLGRRYSLPARPTEVLLNTYGGDYVPYAARRQDYVPRTTPSPQSRVESLVMPDLGCTYAGLRSRTANARSKVDQHKVMLDRYLPINLGPEKDVGMPEYERYRPATQPSKVAPYRPTERRMSLPSTPSRVAPPPCRRAPMSDARKRAREVLCKTKRDPDYFSY